LRGVTALPSWPAACASCGLDQTSGIAAALPSLRAGASRLSTKPVCAVRRRKSPTGQLKQTQRNGAWQKLGQKATPVLNAFVAAAHPEKDPKPLPGARANYSFDPSKTLSIPWLYFRQCLAARS
jgi:hypothetical protein